MKCLYFLSNNIDITHKISDDLHDVGVNDWFVHIISKDDTEVKKHKLHSGNYIEQLDLMRDGIIGAVVGFLVGISTVGYLVYDNTFPPEVPGITYYFIVIVLTMFGAWEGGLTGVASESKKLSAFRKDLDAGKYLILVYARVHQEETINAMMRRKHPGTRLVGCDSGFFNPLSSVQRI